MSQPGQSTSCHNCPGGRRDQAAGSGQGVSSTATVSGDEIDVSQAIASIFALGSLDQQDALLLWTGVNTVLFAMLIYLEVRRDG